MTLAVARNLSPRRSRLVFPRRGCPTYLARTPFPIAETTPYLLQPLPVLGIPRSFLRLIQQPPSLRTPRKTDQPTQHRHLTLLFSWEA